MHLCLGCAGASSVREPCSVRVVWRVIPNYLPISTQLGLVVLFKRARGRPWLSESPGFVAHQLIALVFMSICTLYGGAAPC